MQARPDKKRAMRKALVLLLGALELPVGLSLCIAEDGHSTIELAHAAVPCTSHFQRHHPGATEVEANHLDEHACRDVVVLEVAARRDAPSHGGASAPVRAAFRGRETAGSQALARGRTPAALGAARPLPGERSVVLLI
jgi:hypothetical protein